MPKDIDWSLKDSDGLTNLQRLEKGKPPIDANGNSYHLHHVGQESDGTLALLTQEQHQSNHGILHRFKSESEVNHGPEWDKQKKTFYKNLYEIVKKGF